MRLTKSMDCASIPTGSEVKRIAYRPEIDGLRAIAVLAVVFYHAGFGPAAGFVGVDVFFVISGYLITALLYKEWTVTGRVGMFAFYARRFRRLFAALVLVVTSTVVISVFVLSPFGEVKQVAQSAAASLLFVSNFFLEMTTGGYFDEATDTLPFLHLWSLAVEEQFYLLWPLLLITVLRLRSNLLAPVLAVLALASFLWAELLVTNNPQMAFYQMPARFWELAIGGLIALRPAGSLRNGAVPAFLSLIILLIAVTIPTVHFPGIGALPAVAGAALLLYAVHGSDQLGMAGSLLRSRPMVFFGLISYSLYLWHWPLLALDKATRAGPAPLAFRLLLVVVASLLAWLSYRYVERPTRRADPGTSDQKIVVAGLIASVALAVAALTLGQRLDREPLPTDLASATSRDMPANRIRCNYRGDESLAVFPKPDCLSVPDVPLRIVIWGDSMALAWQPFAWIMGERAGVAATSFSRDACPPLLDYANGKRPLEDRLCREFNTRVLDEIKGIDTLILSSTWMPASRNDMQPANFADYAVRLRETIEQVVPIVKNVILLGPTPHLADSAPRCIRASNLDACAIKRSRFDTRTQASRELLESIAIAYDTVVYADPADFFCTDEICPVLKDGYSLYWDSNHVSSTAARSFAVTYLDEIQD
ncbi:MAG: acyltransferase [Gammaproteobacteria bacterium]|nr:acyltransferase [Gammaproteobacteria bacterium]